MATKHTLKRGSTRPVLRYPLPGVDLTGATATFLMSPRPGRPATVNAPAVIANGALEYHWQPGDTDHAVTHYGEFEVVFPGGAVETFPSDDYIRIVVKQDIGDGGTIAPPAMIVLSGALVEAGADVASGSASVGISLSGAMAEDGSDTASGSLSIVAPGAITLSAALVEAGADTASGEITVAPAPVAAQRVIVLTDYAGDCDDAMALGVACAAHKLGDIHILGVVATSTIATAAPGVYGQLAAYGMQDIPVYAYQGDLGSYNNNISAPVRDAFGVPGQTRAAYEDDVTGLRRMLAASPAGSVKVIDIGAPISTARLLDSPADAISPLTGMQLVAAKVSGLWLMAGDFSLSKAEYNARIHVPSTQRVYHDWPTTVFAHGWEVGNNVFTGPNPDTDASYDPIHAAFIAAGSAGYLNGAGKRQSWDPITVHHAIYGDGSLYNLAGKNGTITVDAEGWTTWSATPAGNRHRVGKAATNAAIAAAIESFVWTAGLEIPPAPVAPSVQTPASISPASGPVGTVFTLTNGTYSGTAPISVAGVLTQDGVDVTSQISGRTFTSTAEGALVWTVTASNAEGQATSTATATVTEAGTEPPSVSPIAEWTFDQSQSGANQQLIPDTTGGGLDGYRGTNDIPQSSDGIWTATGLSFNGNQYATVGGTSGKIPRGSYCVVAVAKHNGGTGSQQIVARDGGGAEGHFQLRFLDGALGFVERSLSPSEIVTDPEASPAGQYVLGLVRVTHNGSAILRKNGQEIRQTSVNTLDTDISTSITFGTRVANSYSERLSGEIVYAAIYGDVSDDHLAAIEQRARAAASAKGITLPGA